MTFYGGFSHPSVVPLLSSAVPAAGCTPPGRVEGLVWRGNCGQCAGGRGQKGNKTKQKTKEGENKGIPYHIVTIISF